MKKKYLIMCKNIIKYIDLNVTIKKRTVEPV